MSSDKAHDAPAIPDHVLPLPAKPNIEFERKRAKHMLRSIGDGDVDALSRVRRHRSAIAPADVKLSDVQLTIAREYGFSSCPKLVSYYETFDRHDRAGPHYQSYRRDYYELHVQWVIDAHARRQAPRTRALAAFVPRFYGRTDEEIFATPITKADAQLVVARNERFPSWDALVEHAGEPRDRKMSVEEEWDEWQRRNPAFLNEAYAAMRRHDADALAPLIDSHPELLNVLDTPPRLGNLRGSILVQLILTEQKEPSPQTSAMIEFLAGRGVNLPCGAQSNAAHGNS